MTGRDDGIRERTRRAIASQKSRTVTVLSSLLAVQDELGYLPDEAIEEVASSREPPPSTKYGVSPLSTRTSDSRPLAVT